MRCTIIQHHFLTLEKKVSILSTTPWLAQLGEVGQAVVGFGEQKEDMMPVAKKKTAKKTTKPAAKKPAAKKPVKKATTKKKK